LGKGLYNNPWFGRGSSTTTPGSARELYNNPWFGKGSSTTTPGSGKELYNNPWFGKGALQQPLVRQGSSTTTPGSARELYNNPWFGKLNLLPRSPGATQRPDLGPKDVPAFGVREELLFGDCATKVHQDMADAVNLMTTVKEQRGQELTKEQRKWVDRYRPRYQKALRALDRRMPGGKGGGGQGGRRGLWGAKWGGREGAGQSGRPKGSLRERWERSPTSPSQYQRTPARKEDPREGQGGQEGRGKGRGEGGGRGRGRGSGGRGRREGERGGGGRGGGRTGEGKRESCSRRGRQEPFWYVSREVAALWDIFPRHTVPQLRRFIIRRTSTGFRHHTQPVAGGED